MAAVAFPGLDSPRNSEPVESLHVSGAFKSCQVALAMSQDDV